jgi:hypothetical protein
LNKFLFAMGATIGFSGCGQYFTSYDVSIETRVPKTIDASASFGKHEFLCGILSGGRCVTVGARAWVTDTARVNWYSTLDSLERNKYFEVGWLPWRWPNQKYHFLFTIFPGDSATMEIQVLQRKDCLHMERGAKVAYVGSSPCSY